VLERARPVVAVHAQRLAERDRIFHRHARSLRHVLRCGVRGVAQQRHAAVRPAVDRVAVGGGPALPAARQVDQLPRLRADALEVALHLFLAALAHAPLLLLARVEGDDDVVLLAAAQRVVHEVAVRACPQAGGVPLQVGREVLAVDDGAIDHVAGDARRVAHELLAHDRLHAVGTDERHAAVRLAALVEHRDAGGVLLDALDPRGREEADAAGLLRALEKAQVHVGAVDHGVGVAEAGAEGLAGGDAADEALVDGVVHHHRLGIDSAGAGALAHAQRIEGGEGVGTELDAGADLADLGRLLEHVDVEAAAHQRQRGGQAADAAAGHEHGRESGGGWHRGLLRERRRRVEGRGGNGGPATPASAGPYC
jgi:hypothetical protein